MAGRINMPGWRQARLFLPTPRLHGTSPVHARPIRVESVILINAALQASEYIRADNVPYPRPYRVITGARLLHAQMSALHRADFVVLVSARNQTSLSILSIEHIDQIIPTAGA